MIATIPSWVATAFWALLFSLVSLRLFTAYIRRLKPSEVTESAPRLPAILFGAGVFVFFQGLAIMPQTQIDWLPGQMSELLDPVLSTLTRYILQFPINYALTGCSLLLAAATILLTPAAFAGMSLRSLGIGTGSVVKGGLQGALTFVIVVPGLAAITILCQHVLKEVNGEFAIQSPVQLMHSYLQMRHAGMFMVACVVIFVAPLVEELLFRALIFPALSEVWGHRFGVIAFGVIFGLAHANLAAFLPLTLFGMILATLYHRTGNLFACIGLHFTFNLVQMIGLIVAWKIAP